MKVAGEIAENLRILDSQCGNHRRNKHCLSRQIMG